MPFTAQGVKESGEGVRAFSFPRTLYSIEKGLCTYFARPSGVKNKGQYVKQPR